MGHMIYHRAMRRMGIDIVFALRLYRRNLRPVVLVTGGLALAVGLSTALITVVRAVTDTSVGLPHADRFFFARRAATGSGPFRPVAPVTTADLPSAVAQLGASSVAGSLVTSAWRIDDRDLDRPAPVHFVSAGFFQMLEAHFARGGGFHTDPDPGVNPPLVISRPAWRHHFGLAENIVGQTVRLNGRAFTVIGIAGRGFSGPHTTAPAFWAPLASFDPDWRDGGQLAATATHVIDLIVRLPDGAPTQWAVDRLSGVLDRPTLRPVVDGGDFKEARPLTAAVGALCVLLLLLGCANVGTLLAATNVERRDELRTRVALGADRSRLMRQLLTEGLVIGALASLGGILLAWWLGPVFLTIGAFPGLDVHLDPLALTMAVIAALASGVISSIWPAWRASAPDRHTARPGRHVLLTIQTTVCLTILGVAGLLERGAATAQTVDVGFDADKVWAINALVGNRSLEEGRERLDRAVQALSAHPAVVVAAIGSGTMFGGGATSMSARAAGGEMEIYTKRIDTNWLRTLGISLLAGRTFTDDDLRADSVVILSRGLARRGWGADDPVGDDAGRLHPSLAGTVVVGVVADALPNTLLDAGSDALTIYRPVRQVDLNIAQVVVRSERPATETFEVIRSVMMATFPGERFRPTQMSALVGFHRAQLRAPARALSLASSAVLVLALIGIAGVTATFVRLRRRDLAIHAVLGADAAMLRRLVARQYGVPVLIGIAGGSCLAVLAGYGMRAMLVGVHPVDPLALGGASVLLLAGAWLASLASSRRATSVQPAEVLRDGY